MIVIDTNVLVALVDERDGLHGRASRDLRGARASGIAVTRSVLSETCFLVPDGSLRRRLRFLLAGLHTRFLDSPPPAIDEIFDWLERYADQEPDFADGELVVISGQQPSVRIWTYDREFRTTWRRTDGSRVPLFPRR